MNARLVLVLALLHLPAQPGLAQVLIRSEPSAPVRGALVRLVATAAGLDLPSSVSGSAGGEPLHFTRRDSITWTALAGIPIEGGDSLTIDLRITRRGARSVDSTEASIRVLPSRAGSERLSVPPSKIILTKSLQQ